MPAEFRFEGTEVEVHSDPETGAVVLTPVRPSARAWLERRDALLRVPGLQAEIESLRARGIARHTPSGTGGVALMQRLMLMLDTNAVSALLKGLSPRLDARVCELRCCLALAQGDEQQAAMAGFVPEHV